MLFNSFEFLIFLPIVFILYWFVFKPVKWQNLLIVVASYVFYGWWSWKFLILIAITTLCSFLSGLLIEKKRETNNMENILASTQMIGFGGSREKCGLNQKTERHGSKLLTERSLCAQNCVNTNGLNKLNNGIKHSTIVRVEK